MLGYLYQKIKGGYYEKVYENVRITLFCFLAYDWFVPSYVCCHYGKSKYGTAGEKQLLPHFWLYYT